MCHSTTIIPLNHLFLFSIAGSIQSIQNILLLSIIYFYQLTIIKKSQKKNKKNNKIRAGSHEYYVNQNGWRVHVMDAHSIIRNQSHIMHVNASCVPL